MDEETLLIFAKKPKKKFAHQTLRKKRVDMKSEHEAKQLPLGESAALHSNGESSGRAYGYFGAHVRARVYCRGVAHH